MRGSFSGACREPPLRYALAVCISLAAMVLATPNIYERIEPVAQLFLRRSASRTANQRRGFFPQGSGDASSPLPSMGNEIELAFEAFGSQHAFNMTLMPSIFSADASITVGVEGDEIRVVPPSQSSYMARFVDASGNDGYAVATLDPATGSLHSGLVHDSGEVYHLQAAALFADALGHVRAEALAAESRAVRGAGLAVYRVADLALFDALGEPLFKCGAIPPPTRPPYRPHGNSDGDTDTDADAAQRRGAGFVTASADDHAGDESHIDYHVPHIPFASPFRHGHVLSDGNESERGPAAARKLLLKRWTNCFSGGARKLRSIFTVDAGSYAALGGTSSSVTLAVASAVALVNTVFYPQLNVYLVVSSLTLRTAPGGEAWNHLARGTAGSTCPSGAEALLTSFTQWKTSDAARRNDYGVAHLITSCFPPPGTVGLAYVGTVGSRDYATGWSQSGSGMWLTIAHEIGHNFGAQHTFQNGQGTTGGVMDYGDGKLLVSDPSDPGEYGFHTALSKAEMCATLSSSMSGTSGFSVVSPITKAWESFTPVCGDGILDPSLGEECDSGLPAGNACCTAQCKLTDGSTCSGDSQCCVNCRLQPVSTPCGSQSRCGANGACTPTKCAHYSNTRFCDVHPSNSCQERCAIPPSTQCNIVTPVFNRDNGDYCMRSGGSTGVCTSGQCQALTYTVNDITAWGACECPAAIQRRSFVCKTQLGVIVAQSFCSSTLSEQPCPCASGSDWVAGEWGACSSLSCAAGAGIQTRTVECRTPLGAAADDCPQGTQPTSTRACTRMCTYSWACRSSASVALSAATACSANNEFSACSTTCGTGTRTRVVACVDELSQAAADSLCSGTKPGASLSCTATDTCVWRCFGTSTASSTAVACGVDTGYGACSASCGSGQQTRAVGCFGASSTQPLSDSFCLPNALTKPTSARACSGVGCQMQWYCAAPGASVSVARLCSELPSWGTCSSTCGSGQRQRQTFCMNQIGEIGSCGAAPSPLQSESCSSTAACAWGCKPDAQTAGAPQTCAQISSFAACSTDCGAGTRTRDVRCYAPASSTPIDDEMCPVATAGAKPVLSSPCQGSACVYQFYCAAPGTAAASAVPCTPTTGWSACGATCGTSTRTRQVMCLDQNKQAAPSTFHCSGQVPVASEVCTGTSTCVWSPSAWSACSATCGLGLHTRTVTCHDSATQAARNNTLCSELSPLATSGTCVGSGCVHQFYCHALGSPQSGAVPCSQYTGWSACSTQCGAGTRSRAVSYLCRDQTGAVSSDGSLCSGQTPPAVEEQCRSTAACAWRCKASAVATAFDECTGAAAWSTCSESCGPGTRSRVVSCYDTVTSATVADLSLCIEQVGTAPAASDTCEVRQCQFVWHCYATGAASATAVPCTAASSWSACGASCGSATQTRQTICLDAVTRELGSCLDQRPAQSRTCSATHGCAWKCHTPGSAVSTAMACSTSAGFGQCSATCGAGSRTRSVVCVDGANAAVPDSWCALATAGVRPVASAACDGDGCVYGWRCGAAGLAPSALGACDTEASWGACSTSCGSALQTRQIVCVNQNGAAGVVGDALCTAARPAVDRTCTATSACAWQCHASGEGASALRSCADSSTWDSCSLRCGTGQQQRHVGCYAPGSLLALTEGFCAGLTRPASQQQCIDADCAFSWHCAASGRDVAAEGVPCSINDGFGDCHTTCGSQLQLRALTCMRPNGTLGAPPDCNPGGETDSLPDLQQCSVTTGCGWRCFSPDGGSGGDCADAATWGSTCSAECGSGIRSRFVRCVSGADGGNVEDSLCADAALHGPRPDDVMPCLGSSCMYHWYCYAPDADPATATLCTESAGWSQCATTCGEASRYRTAVCRDQEGNDALGLCPEAVPAMAEPCSSTAACSWLCRPYTAADTAVDCSLAESWSPCSAPCGLGDKNRVVECRGGPDVVTPALSDSFCPLVTAGAKPAATGSCLDAPCQKSWFCSLPGTEPWAANLCAVAPDLWSACSAACGPGVRVRTVACLDVDTRLPSEGCAEERPAHSVACADAAACGWQCFPSGVATPSTGFDCASDASWSKCSADCEAGMRTRTVRCAGSDSLVDDTYCAGLGVRPVTEMACTGGACVNQWYCHATGAAQSTAVLCGAETAWSACGTDCGTAEQTRVAVCLNQASSASTCTEAQPVTTRACQGMSACRWRCKPTALSTLTDCAAGDGAWGACSASCGSGVRGREAVCVDPVSNTVLDADLCSDTAVHGPRPAENGTCLAGVCAVTWHCAAPGGADPVPCVLSSASAAWGACPTACGMAERAREVTCRDTATLEERPEAECSGETQPTKSEQCTATAACGWECAQESSDGAAVACTAGAELSVVEAATWPSCSVDCGAGVTQRSVRCINTALDTVAPARTVADALCAGVGVKPVAERPCSGARCIYQWYCSAPGSLAPPQPCADAAAWGDCGTTCGTSVQTRTVKCLDQTGGTGSCVEAAPPTSQPCSRSDSCRWQCRAPLAMAETQLSDSALADTFHSCDSTPAAQTGWSTCSTACGTGTRTREVVCHTGVYGAGAAAVLPESFCSPDGAAGAKPALLGMCTNTQCADSWFCGIPGGSAGDAQWCGAPGVADAVWSSCNTTCGTTIQERTAVCRTVATGAASEACPEARPVLSRLCSVSTGCTYTCRPTAQGSQRFGCVGESSWGACSAACDAGTQTRVVSCTNPETVDFVDGGFCSALAVPEASRACTVKPCTFSWRCYADGADPASALPCSDAASWGVCASTCGASTQVRRRVCVNDDTGVPVTDATLCGAAEAGPAVEQECFGTTACRWACRAPDSALASSVLCSSLTSANPLWGTCGATCGAGHRARVVECRPGSGAGLTAGAAMPDSFCAQATAGAKPAVSVACHAAPCQKSWFCRPPGAALSAATLCADAPGWGVCSNSCGLGTRTRTAQCLDITTRLESNECIETRPEEQNVCQGRSACAWMCYNADHLTPRACTPDTFAACGAGACARGIQYREVFCFPPNKTATVPTSYCTTDNSAGPRPDASRTCVNTGGCAFRWQCRAPGTIAWADCVSGEAQFGSCATGCGDSIRLRDVQCFNGFNVAVPDSACVTTKPAVERACTSTQGCSFAWRCFGDSLSAASACGSASHWGTCSTTCGDGTQTRGAACFNLLTNTPVEDSRCPLNSAPSTSRACSSSALCEWRAGPWGQCSAACRASLAAPNAVRTRGVICGGFNATGAFVATTDTQLCTGVEPAAAEQCANTPACATDGTTTRYEWASAAPTGTCVGACDSGYRARAVTCRVSGSDTTVHDGFCAPAERPAGAVACETARQCPISAVAAAAGVASARCVTAPTLLADGVTRIDAGVCQCVNGFYGDNCASVDTVSDFKFAPSSPVVHRSANLYLSWVYADADADAELTIVYERTGASDAFPVPVATVAAAAGAFVWLVPADLPAASAARLAAYITPVARARSAAFSVGSACTQLRCNGHGTCNEDAASGVTSCACDDGYTGARCEVAPCAEARCYEPGTESQSVDSATGLCRCTCKPGYTGDACLTPVLCVNMPLRVRCMNNGVNTESAACSTCSCAGFWEDSTDDLAGSPARGCTECGLRCAAGGTPSPACDACDCSEGYAGARCQCRAVRLELSFATAELGWADLSAARRDALYVLAKFEIARIAALPEVSIVPAAPRVYDHVEFGEHVTLAFDVLGGCDLNQVQTLVVSYEAPALPEAQLPADSPGSGSEGFTALGAATNASTSALAFAPLAIVGADATMADVYTGLRRVITAFAAAAHGTPSAVTTASAAGSTLSGTALLSRAAVVHGVYVHDANCEADSFCPRSDGAIRSVGDEDGGGGGGCVDVDCTPGGGGGGGSGDGDGSGSSSGVLSALEVIPGIPGWASVVIIIGGGVLVLILIITILCICCRRKPAAEQRYEPDAVDGKVPPPAHIEMTQTTAFQQQQQRQLQVRRAGAPRSASATPGQPGRALASSGGPTGPNAAGRSEQTQQAPAQPQQQVPQTPVEGVAGSSSASASASQPQPQPQPQRSLALVQATQAPAAKPAPVGVDAPTPGAVAALAPPRASLVVADHESQAHSDDDSRLNTPQVGAAVGKSVPPMQMPATMVDGDSDDDYGEGREGGYDA